MSDEPKAPETEGKKKYPDLKMRLSDEDRADWMEGAKEDGIDQLATWIKKVVRDYRKKQKRKVAAEK